VKTFLDRVFDGLAAWEKVASSEEKENAVQHTGLVAIPVHFVILFWWGAAYLNFVPHAWWSLPLGLTAIVAHSALALVSLPFIHYFLIKK